MNVYEFIRQKNIPTKKLLAEILGVSDIAFNHRINRYGYTEIRQTESSVEMVNPEAGRIISHPVTDADIKRMVDRYWRDK